MLMKTMKELKKAWTAKVDNICTLHAIQRGDDPATIPSVRRGRIAEEVEELIEKWDMATHEDPALQPKNELERLLAELQYIDENIMVLRDERLMREYPDLMDDREQDL